LVRGGYRDFVKATRNTWFWPLLSPGQAAVVAQTGGPAQGGPQNHENHGRGEAQMSGKETPGESTTGSNADPTDPLRRNGEITAQASATAGALREEAAGTLADIKAEGAGVAEAAKERAASFAEEQKRIGAKQAETLARAVHGAADDLQETAPGIARYVHEAASAVDGLARGLRDSSPGELMGRVEDLARRQPVAFFGAAVLAGFALARFARSSAENARRREADAGAHGRLQAAAGGDAASPSSQSSGTGAPGWVPAAPGRSDDAAPQATRPATLAAASLSSAAARPRPPIGPQDEAS
jgi:hypothetical protein